MVTVQKQVTCRDFVFSQQPETAASDVAFKENFVDDLEVNDAIASRMSLFYAHATPMLKVLSDTTSKFVSEVICCRCCCICSVTI